jgi:hypothetical protein
MLALGFSEAQASHFLRQCQGNMERAIDAILANPDWQPPPQQQGRDDGDRTGVAAAADVTSSHSTYSSSHANQGLPGAGEGGGAVPLESAHASLREAHETSLAENAALRADNASLQGELTMLRDALSHALRGDPVLAHALAASPARCLSTLAAAAVATAAASPPCAPEPAPEPEPARPAAAPSLPPGSAQLAWTFGAAAPVLGSWPRLPRQPSHCAGVGVMRSRWCGSSTRSTGRVVTTAGGACCCGAKTGAL